MPAFPTYLTADTAAEMLSLFRKVDPAQPPLWGKLDAAGMVRHLTLALEMSLGEFTLPDRSNFVLRSALGKYLAFWVVPIPRGLRAPKAYTPPPEGSFENELRLFERQLHRFCETLANYPEVTANHVLFGPLTMKEWSRLHSIHFRHHLKQFRAV